jgi:hypothetical protein
VAAALCVLQVDWQLLRSGLLDIRKLRENHYFIIKGEGNGEDESTGEWTAYRPDPYKSEFFKPTIGGCPSSWMRALYSWAARPLGECVGKAERERAYLAARFRSRRERRAPPPVPVDGDGVAATAQRMSVSDDSG